MAWQKTSLKRAELRKENQLGALKDLILYEPRIVREEPPHLIGGSQDILRKKYESHLLGLQI